MNTELEEQKKHLLGAAEALLSRKHSGPSEDAHVFAEWDDLADAIKAVQ